MANRNYYTEMRHFASDVWRGHIDLNDGPYSQYVFFSGLSKKLDLKTTKLYLSWRPERLKTLHLLEYSFREMFRSSNGVNNNGFWLGEIEDNYLLKQWGSELIAGQQVPRIVELQPNFNFIDGNVVFKQFYINIIWDYPPEKCTLNLYTQQGII